MKNLRKIYLILVSISFTMNMVWTFFREIYWSNFSEEVQRLLQVDGYGSVMPGAENLFMGTSKNQLKTPEYILQNRYI